MNGQASHKGGTRYCRLCLCTLLFLSASLLRGQEWTKIQITDRSDGFEGETILPTVVVDRNRVIHVLYARTTQVDSSDTFSSRATSFHYTSNSSGFFTSPKTIFDGAGSPFNSFALDSNLALSALYTADRLPNSQCLQLSRIEPGGTWEDEYVDICSGKFSATAVDPTGRLHVTYVLSGTIFYLSRSSSGAWSSPINISGSGGDDDLPSIAVSSSGTVHIVFYRQNSQTRQTLYYVSGSGTNFSSPLSLRLLSRSVNQLSKPYTWPPHAPSIAVDGEGICHIVFTSIFGQNPESSHILYMNNQAGSWSDPESITNIGFYNRVSITLDQNKNIHVAAERFDGNDWDIVYLQQRNGAWIGEQDLTANDVDDFAGGSGGRFIARHDSTLAIAYQTFEKIDPGRTSPLDKNEIALLTTFLTPAPALSVSLDTIDFGTVRVGTCRDSALRVKNVGAGLLSSNAPHSIEGDTQVFTINDDGEFALPPNVEDSLLLSFCPNSTGSFEAILHIKTNAGERPVLLRGIGEGNKTSYYLSLDTITAHVGNRFRLSVNISPPLTEDAAVDSFAIGVTFNPNSLFFHQLVGGHGAQVIQLMNGHLLIQRPLGELLVDSVLFQLEFEGLVSGQPINDLPISEVFFLGLLRPVDTARGRVYLEGCDIERGVGFGRRIGVTSINPNPVSNAVRIRWHAPQGAEPQLQVVDQLGRTAIHQTLQSGTEGENEITLELGELQPGHYRLQMIDRAERTTVPLIIVR
ncbi:MAG: hypothetical protein KDD67_00705 [Ignavibacteriae bacterium]|nr:hypothetical protein [Ignavibacteriota bacterium]